MRKHPAGDAILSVLAAVVLIMTACALAVLLAEASMVLISIGSGWIAASALLIIFVGVGAIMTLSKK